MQKEEATQKKEDDFKDYWEYLDFIEGVARTKIQGSNNRFLPFGLATMICLRNIFRFLFYKKCFWVEQVDRKNRPQYIYKSLLVRYRTFFFSKRSVVVTTANPPVFFVIENDNIRKIGTIWVPRIKMMQIQLSVCLQENIGKYLLKKRSKGVDLRLKFINEAAKH